MCASKLDKTCHELFASTLRPDGSSSGDETVTSNRLKCADKVAALAKKLSDTKTLKLNLLKLLKLHKLPEVEKDFLKAAIPTLTCAARPYNTPHNLENGIALINEWAGVYHRADLINAKEVTELLISPQAFKNTLLKLLNGKSDDHRVVVMRKHIEGKPWCDSTEELENDVGDDDQECVFQPKLNKYPQYLKNAPKKAYPKNTIAGKLDHLLDTPQRKFEHDEEADDSQAEYERYDYGTPSNVRCPFNTPMNRNAKGVGFHDKALLFKKVIGEEQHDEYNPSRRRGARVKQTNAESNAAVSHQYDSNTQLLNGDEVDEIFNRVPGIDERLPRFVGKVDPHLHYVRPKKNRIPTELWSMQQHEENKMWPASLRGGYLGNDMRFSSDTTTHHAVDHNGHTHVGSMKRCDYIMPHGMLTPSFGHRVPDVNYENRVYNGKHENTKNASDPLDVLEAQLAAPIVNVMKLRC